MPGDGLEFSRTYNALQGSGLLGRATPKNKVLCGYLQHYEWYGTQWQVAGCPPLSTRMVSAGIIQAMSQPPDTGDRMHPGVQTWSQVRGRYRDHRLRNLEDRTRLR